MHRLIRTATLCALGAALALAPSGAARADAAPPAESAAQAEPSPEPAAAAPAKKTRKQLREEAKKYAQKPRTARIFSATREHLAAERYAEAEASLRKLRMERLSPHERAQTNRMLGYAAYGMGRNDAAIELLSKALTQDGLAPVDRGDVLFQIAQIQGAEKRWQDVIRTLEAWFEVAERPNSVGYYLLALSHYQLEDYDAALLPAKKAVAIAKSPQQVWLQLLLAIHLVQKDYESATPVLFELVSRYPNSAKGYWLQLSALYGVGEDHERALGVLELAYRKGLLTEDRDLRRLAQLLLFRELPQRAAAILDAELRAQRIQPDAEAYELLSSSYILARETARAEEPLARAAELSPKGNLYVRLAQVHLSQGEFDAAASALHRALAKGGVDDPGGAELLLGVTYYNEKKLREARSWFARAQRSDSARKQAQTWLEHLDREHAAHGAAADAADAAG